MSIRPPFLKTEELIANPEHRTTASLMKAEFSMDDLNGIHALVGIAGSLSNIGPLHHQKVLRREVVPSESAKLHLVWFERVLFVKPLHDYLLSFECYNAIVCKDHDLHSLIIGFLLSYMRLIQTPLDLDIAKDLHLISGSVRWKQWDAFRQSVLKNTINDTINRRYQYGELRLGRLDLIWRCTGRGLTYFTVHREYSTYFDQYFALFITVFAFVAVILTAMQVALAASTIPDELRTVCYHFSIVVLIGICGCFLYTVVVFLSMFFYNLIAARLAHKRHKI